MLASAERVERLCTESYAALYESDDAVLGASAAVWRRVGELAALDPRFEPYLEARDGIKSQLEDLALFLRRYADGIEASPARLQQVEERLALLERLKRKYGPTLADVIARRATPPRGARRPRARRRTAAPSSSARIAQAARPHIVAARRPRSSTARRRSRPDVRPARSRRCSPSWRWSATRFEVRFAEPLPRAAWTRQGIDRAEFFVSPNPGEDLRPLARIVSGGELSRIMLAIKTLTATSRHGFSEAADRPPSDAARPA